MKESLCIACDQKCVQPFPIDACNRFTEKGRKAGEARRYVRNPRVAVLTHESNDLQGNEEEE